MYIIWLSVLIIHAVTLTLVIMSELHNFTSSFNLVICLWILYVMSWFNPVICYTHIIIRFFHVQLFTNEYPYYFRFSSFTSLYEWLSIFLLDFIHARLGMNDYPLFFVMHVFVRITVLFQIYFLCVSVKWKYFHVSLLILIR